MPIYQYTVYDENGKKQKRKNNFNDKKEVIDFLTKNNLYATNIKIKSSIFSKSSKLTYNDLYFICSQLSVLINSGCDIIHSLNTIQCQSNKKIQNAIKPIIKNLQSGYTLSKSFESQNLFSVFFINMLNAGELSGNLDYIMEKLANYYTKEKEFKQKVISSLIYPVILMIVCTCVVVFLLIYVVPNFADIFSQNGVELPIISKIMLDTSNIFKEYCHIIIFFLMFLILMVTLSVINNKNIKYSFAKLKTQIIYVKNVYQLIYINKFIRSFYILISSGVSIVDALEISSKVIQNEYIYDRLTISKVNIMKGQNIYDSLKKSKIFPTTFLTMIQVGEQGGKLDEILFTISNYYEKELSAKLNKVMKLIEPIIILVMGLVIGLVVMSIALPMFDIMNTI